MTNLWPSINTLRMEATRLRQTSRRVEAAEDMDIAATLLEAAGNVLENSGLPPDHILYITAFPSGEQEKTALPDKVTP